MRPPSVCIAATDMVPPAAEEAFSRVGQIKVVGSDFGAAADAEVLIVRATPVTAGLLDALPRLKVIARTGVGLDTIDLDAVSHRRIPLLCAPDTATRPIAEGTLALILAASKRLRELGSLVNQGRWGDRYGCEVRDLRSAVLGVVGLGRIGSEVAELSRALGMHVVACDPQYTATKQPPQSVALLTLQELFACADVVTLHCPLNDSTRGMIGRELLAGAKPGGILINASRGGLIEGEGVLLEALSKGWLAGLGLDVFPTEPPDPDSQLLRDPRVICTPHAVGLSRSWNEYVFNALAGDVARVLRGLRPANIANPEVLAPFTATPISHS